MFLLAVLSAYLPICKLSAQFSAPLNSSPDIVIDQQNVAMAFFVLQRGLLHFAECFPSELEGEDCGRETRCLSYVRISSGKGSEHGREQSYSHTLEKKSSQVDFHQVKMQRIWGWV